MPPSPNSVKLQKFKVLQKIPNKKWKGVISKSFENVTVTVFFRSCTHILTRTQGKKFEDMFLVKIASQGTSLNFIENSLLF